MRLTRRRKSSRKALGSYGDNYTEQEKSELESKLEEINVGLTAACCAMKSWKIKKKDVICSFSADVCHERLKPAENCLNQYLRRDCYYM